MSFIRFPENIYWLGGPYEKKSVLDRLKLFDGHIYGFNVLQFINNNYSNNPRIYYNINPVNHHDINVNGH